jgi:hypothetical protein
MWFVASASCWGADGRLGQCCRKSQPRQALPGGSFDRFDIESQPLVAPINASGQINLKLPMDTPAKDIHRPTIGIVGGVSDELIVEREVR